MLLSPPPDVFILLYRNAEFHNTGLRNSRDFYLEQHSQVFNLFQDKPSQEYCIQINRQRSQRVLLGQHKKLSHPCQDLNCLLAHTQPTVHTAKHAAGSAMHVAQATQDIFVRTKYKKGQETRPAIPVLLPKCAH